MKSDTSGIENSHLYVVNIRSLHQTTNHILLRMMHVNYIDLFVENTIDYKNDKGGTWTSFILN